MKRSTDRILTAHCGSLARPNDLLEMTRAKLAGEPYDPQAFAARIRSAVKEQVARQVECGIDVVNDGEQSKDSFYAYARERLSGLEAAAPEPGRSRSGTREIMAFPEFYRDYYFIPRSKGRVGPDLVISCTGPVSYVGWSGQSSRRWPRAPRWRRSASGGNGGVQSTALPRQSWGGFTAKARRTRRRWTGWEAASRSASRRPSWPSRLRGFPIRQRVRNVTAG